MKLGEEAAQAMSVNAHPKPGDRELGQFRTPAADVMVLAETVAGGARCYTPLVANWARVGHQYPSGFHQVGCAQRRPWPPIPVRPR
jgi:hypothetical protein